CGCQVFAVVRTIRGSGWVVSRATSVNHGESILKLDASGSGGKQRGEMRIYEIMFIVRPDVPEEDLDKLIAQFDGIVTSTGGKVQKAEKWGRRRLAYEVKRCREGMYLLFTIECDLPTVREFERRLQVT